MSATGHFSAVNPCDAVKLSVISQLYIEKNLHLDTKFANVGQNNWVEAAGRTGFVRVDVLGRRTKKVSLTSRVLAVLAAVWALGASAALAQGYLPQQQQAGQADPLCNSIRAMTGRDRANASPSLLARCGYGNGQNYGNVGYNAGNPGRTVRAERYVPTIWVDPDGCQHWVMDDGWEGFMTPNVTPDGIPVCNRVPACKIMPADQLFATDHSNIRAAARRELENFFRSAGATAYIIEGHTDSRASDEYNMGLSMRRANAVAAIAQSVGARVAAIRGFGEREPRATNRTAAGMALNRRVEIKCIR